MRTGTTAADIVRIIILICIMFRTEKVLSFMALGQMPEILFIDLFELSKNNLKFVMQQVTDGISRKTENPQKDNRKNIKGLIDYI